MSTKLHAMLAAGLVLLLVAPAAEAAPITSGWLLWLDANDPATISGSPVAQWDDKAAPANDATASGTQRPTYSAGTGPNGTGEVSFDGSNDRLNAGTVIPQSSSATIFFLLDRPNTAGRGGVFQRQTGPPYSGYGLGQGSSTAWSFLAWESLSDGVAPTVSVKSGLQMWQATVDFNAAPSTTTARLFEDGALVATDSGNDVDSIGTGSDPLLIMNRDFGTSIAGDVGEIIVYGRVLNSAERIITQNYLSSKFDLTLAADDFYAGDTPGNSHFDHDVFGLGNDQSIGPDPGSVTSATSTGGAVTMAMAAEDLDDGDFLLAGFRNDNDFTQGTFYLDQTDLDGDETLDLTFDLSVLGLSNSYFLGFHPTDPNRLGFLQNGVPSGDDLLFALAGGQIQDGFYGLVTPEPTSAVVFAGLVALAGMCRWRRRRRSRGA